MAARERKVRHKYLLLTLFSLSPLSLALTQAMAADADADADATGSNATAAAPASAAIDERHLVQMMEEARQAMYEQDYNHAIEIYQKLVNMPEHLYRRDALESLGLAYERSGDFEEAQRSYERYLQLYPQGEPTARVRQRLAALVTATWQRPKVVEKKPEPSNWRTYGSIYQFMRRSGMSTDQTGMVIAQHAIITIYDINSRGKEGGVDIKSRVSGSHLYDLQNEHKAGPRQRLSYLYLDLSHRSSGLYGRIGRQRTTGGGVLGRFDGINMGLRFNPQYAVNLVAGMPVNRTSDVHINHNRKFHGISLEGGPWHDYWLANGYYIEQTSEGYLDRKAAGMELRYMHPKLTVYSLLDYDLYFTSLNIFTTQINWTTESKTSFNLLLDYRNGPPITLRSALFGQSVATLKDLHEIYSDAELQQLAQDRTPHYYMAAMGMARPITEHYRWEADATATKLGDTTASGGVSATKGTGVEYYYSTRFSASDYFRKGDINILGLYFSHGDTSRMVTLSLNSRVPLGKQWYINPRLQVGRRHQNGSGATDTISGAGFKVEYMLTRSMTLEFNSSSNWVETQALLGTQHSQSFYVTAGYRWLF